MEKNGGNLPKTVRDRSKTVEKARSKPSVVAEGKKECKIKIFPIIAHAQSASLSFLKRIVRPILFYPRKI